MQQLHQFVRHKIAASAADNRGISNVVGGSVFELRYKPRSEIIFRFEPSSENTRRVQDLTCTNHGTSGDWYPLSTFFLPEPVVHEIVFIGRITILI